MELQHRAEKGCAAMGILGLRRGKKSAPLGLTKHPPDQ